MNEETLQEWFEKQVRDAIKLDRAREAAQRVEYFEIDHGSGFREWTADSLMEGYKGIRYWTMQELFEYLDDVLGYNCPDTSTNLDTFVKNRDAYVKERLEQIFAGKFEI